MRRRRVKIKEKHEKLIGQIFLISFLLLAVFIGGLYLKLQGRLIAQEINTEDSGIKLDNPERGWYQISGFVTESGKNEQEILEEFLQTCKSLRTNKDRLLEYQILLQKPAKKNAEIDSKDLEIIRKELQIMREMGVQAIVRPLYDWNGDINKEPSQFDTMVTHIKQLGKLFSDYDDVIITIEAGLLGPFGEWHSTKYNSIEDMKNIVIEYLRATKKTMQISIRRPEFYRAIFNTKSPVEEKEAYDGADKNRVGFYNDGYLGSESDLGTYTEWTRGQELKFQYQHNRFLYFGGEATLISKYGKLFQAIDDMNMTHCTYLNKEHYLPLKEVWKKTKYEGKKAYNQAYIGKTGYEYIEDHLGYRFLLQSSYMPKGVFRGFTMKGKFSIYNSGFGNMIKEKQTFLYFVKGKEKFQIPLDLDIRKWYSGICEEEYNIQIPKNISSGDWNIYLTVMREKEPIEWANKQGYNSSIGGIYLGNIHFY